MDARRLSETKSLLKKRNSMDRSKPMIEDAAHPGSANILRAISAGHFDLKHAETEHDGSAPMLEPGTGVHADIRPHVFQELSSSFSPRRSSLKPTKTNDRSEPVIEKWVHVDITSKPARKSVIEELKEKKSTIEAMHHYNEGHTKEAIEKNTRPALMSEIKSYKNLIEEQSANLASHSKAEMSKHVHVGLMDEIHKKKGSIENFSSHAAEVQSEENYRSQTKPALCNEINSLMKKQGSIKLNHVLTRDKSQPHVGGDVMQTMEF